MRDARQPAQTLAIFAVLLAVLLGVVGLVFSLGLLVVQRQNLQAAVDAASLAGTWEVLGQLQSAVRDDAAVQSTVEHFLSTNGIDSSDPDTTVTAVYVDETGLALSPAAIVGQGTTFPEAARGVRVDARVPVATVLAGFFGGTSTVEVQSSGAAALAPTVAPSTMALVIPVAVSATDYLQARANGAVYNLMAPPNPPTGGNVTLDFVAVATSPASGATDYGDAASNLQAWSDGQHENGQLQVGGTVSLHSQPRLDAVLTGLQDNVRRQALVGPGGERFALVFVPLWDSSAATPAPGTIRLVGFALLRLAEPDVTASSASGSFVPYPAAAWSPKVASAPVPDVWARTVTLVR